MANLPDQHQQIDDKGPTTKQSILLKPTMIVEAPLPPWKLTMSTTTTGDDSHRSHDHTQDLQNYVIIQMVRSSGQRPPLRPKPCHHHWQFLLVGWSTTLVLNLVIHHHRRCFRSHPQVGWWWIKKMKKSYLVMVLAHRWQVSSKWCWMFRRDRIVDAPVLSLFSWNMHSINCHSFIHHCHIHFEVTNLHTANWSFCRAGPLAITEERFQSFDIFFVLYIVCIVILSTVLGSPHLECLN